MRIAIGIPTAGRPEILAETLAEFGCQTRLPNRVVVAPASETCVHRSKNKGLPFDVDIVESEPGSSRQRNAILAACEDCDIVIFFDDDFFPVANFLANTEKLFQSRPDVVMATGHVIEDGIKGPGISVEDARRILAATTPPSPTADCYSFYGAYGCNMVVALAPVREHRVRFDEELPLYGWQEDTDFSRRMAKYGPVVRSNALAGVHLGIKRGRTSGVRLGYSQVANPIYLIRKGTMTTAFGMRLIVKNLIANAVKSVRPEPYIDRSGRTKGNFLALRDLLRGRLHPSRMLEFN